MVLSTREQGGRGSRGKEEVSARHEIEMTQEPPCQAQWEEDTSSIGENLLQLSFASSFPS